MLCTIISIRAFTRVDKICTTQDEDLEGNIQSEIRALKEDFQTEIMLVLIQTRSKPCILFRGNSVFLLGVMEYDQVNSHVWLQRVSRQSF